MHPSFYQFLKISQIVHQIITTNFATDQLNMFTKFSELENQKLVHPLIFSGFDSTIYYNLPRCPSIWLRFPEVF